MPSLRSADLLTVCTLGTAASVLAAAAALFLHAIVIDVAFAPAPEGIVFPFLEDGDRLIDRALKTAVVLAIALAGTRVMLALAGPFGVTDPRRLRAICIALLGVASGGAHVLALLLLHRTYVVAALMIFVPDATDITIFSLLLLAYAAAALASLGIAVSACRRAGLFRRR